MQQDDPRYALEKFSQAVHDLVTHPGRVQDRLYAAYMRFHTVRAADLPEGELRRLFVGIKDDLTFVEPSDPQRQGRLGATLQISTDEDASAVAARIFRLYYDLRDWLKENESTGGRAL
jgi:hypothetical protein